jgi:hypothetical protein
MTCLMSGRCSNLTLDIWSGSLQREPGVVTSPLTMDLVLTETLGRNRPQKSGDVCVRFLFVRDIRILRQDSVPFRHGRSKGGRRVVDSCHVQSHHNGNCKRTSLRRTRRWKSERCSKLDRDWRPKSSKHPQRRFLARNKVCTICNQLSTRKSLFESLPNSPLARPCHPHSLSSQCS